MSQLRWESEILQGISVHPPDAPQSMLISGPASTKRDPGPCAKAPKEISKIM